MQHAGNGHGFGGQIAHALSNHKSKVSGLSWETWWLVQVDIQRTDEGSITNLHGDLFTRLLFCFVF